jgi:hypothetical protein
VELIERLEAEGGGQRGYVAEQIRERLRAFELLAKVTGETDVTTIMAKLIQSAANNSSAAAQSSTPTAAESQESSKSERTRQNILQMRKGLM